MVYNYKCRKCENIFEIEHSMKVSNAVEELGSSCPKCGSDDIFKYLGNMKTAYITFKGPGFSVNDSALDRVGFPKHYRENPEIRDKLSKI